MEHIIRALHRLLGDRPHRDAWNIKYGIYLDPVGTVWLDRDCQHADRQRLLDASQNVMTRLL